MTIAGSAPLPKAPLTKGPLPFAQIVSEAVGNKQSFSPTDAFAVNTMSS